jgi:hypothetical protein
LSITAGIVSVRMSVGLKFDDLRPRVVDGCVAGRNVVGVAGVVGLLAVRERKATFPLIT